MMYMSPLVPRLGGYAAIPLFAGYLASADPNLHAAEPPGQKTIGLSWDRSPDSGVEHYTLLVSRDGMPLFPCDENGLNRIDAATWTNGVSKVHFTLDNNSIYNFAVVSVVGDMQSELSNIIEYNEFRRLLSSGDTDIPSFAFRYAPPSMTLTNGAGLSVDVRDASSMFIKCSIAGDAIQNPTEQIMYDEGFGADFSYVVKFKAPGTNNWVMRLTDMDGNTAEQDFQTVYLPPGTEEDAIPNPYEFFGVSDVKFRDGWLDVHVTGVSDNVLVGLERKKSLYDIDYAPPIEWVRPLSGSNDIHFLERATNASGFFRPVLKPAP